MTGPDLAYPVAEGAPGSDARGLERLRDENLVTFAVIASTEADNDRAYLVKLSDWAADKFLYYEILVVAAQPVPGWTEAMRELGTKLDNLRISTVQSAISYEDCNVVALEHAIGDYVVLLFPGEIEIPDVEALTKTLASGTADIVRVRFREGRKGRIERWSAGLAALVMRALTGHRFQQFPARAIGLTRAAVTQLQHGGAAARFFRILNLSGYLSEDHVSVDSPPRRRFWSALPEKLRVVSDLISLSATRMVRILALACLTLALVSFAATLGSLIIWFLLAEIAPGWTSLAMLLSFLFGANFSVLGAICLGLLQLIRQTAPELESHLTSELAGGDFVSSDTRLNVLSEDGQDTGGSRD